MAVFQLTAFHPECTSSPERPLFVHGLICKPHTGAGPSVAPRVAPHTGTTSNCSPLPCEEQWGVCSVGTRLREDGSGGSRASPLLKEAYQRLKASSVSWVKRGVHGSKGSDWEVRRYTPASPIHCSPGMCFDHRPLSVSYPTFPIPQGEPHRSMKPVIYIHHFSLDSPKSNLEEGIF